MTALRSGFGEVRSRGTPARCATRRSMPAAAWATPMSDSRWPDRPLLLLGARVGAAQGPQLLQQALARRLVLLARDLGLLLDERVGDGVGDPRRLPRIARGGADEDEVRLGVDLRLDRARQPRRGLAVADLLGGAVEHVGGDQQLADGGQLTGERVDVDGLGGRRRDALDDRRRRGEAVGRERGQDVGDERGAEGEREDQPAPAAHGVDVAADLDRLVGSLAPGRPRRRAPVGGFVESGLEGRHRVRALRRTVRVRKRHRRGREER